MRLKMVFASDSFKGSLTSDDTIKLLTKAAEQVFPGSCCIGLPVADGGEGTADAVIKAAKGKRISVSVHDPLMRITDAYYGVINDDTAVIESALASGLTLMSEDERDPLYASTSGTGELIFDALERGYRKIYITVGGSATNDGGMGCMKALGAKFLDSSGYELDGCGRDLAFVDRIDLSSFDTRIKECTVTVMCDVNNPLTGERGAVRMFSAQKGADPLMMEELEKGMINYRDVIRRQYSVDCDEIKGAGAAGGLGAALAVFCNGKMSSGIESVLSLVNFDECIKGADLIITGEGKLDGQSMMGKVISGVSRHAKSADVPVIALCGCVDIDESDMEKLGLLAALSTASSTRDIDYSMKNAAELYYSAALNLFNIIKTGMKISEK